MPPGSVLSGRKASGGGAPGESEVKASTDAITKFNLPSDAGFLLSLVDGSTSVADLVSLSGMDAFEALRTFRGLLETGIVGMDG